VYLLLVLCGDGGVDVEVLVLYADAFEALLEVLHVRHAGCSQ